MDTTNPKPGVYRLTKDIQNPKPDGRVRRDWRAEKVWKAGWLFLIETRVQDESELAGQPVPAFTRVRISKTGDRYRLVNSLEDSIYNKPPHDRVDDERMVLLLEAFEPVEDTTFTLLDRLDAKHWTPEILDTLVKAGKITLADIENAYEQATKDAE